jgi:hypothetical protein
MLSKFWRWLNREDTRARYPDGQLVIRGPWVAGAVEQFFDLFPLWVQRAGGLVLQLAAWCIVAAVAGKLIGII